MSEKIGKNFVNFIKRGTDSNISVQNSYTYSRRFVRFMMNNIAEEGWCIPEAEEES